MKAIMKTNRVYSFLGILFVLTLFYGNAWGASYTITFATNSGDGTSASTSTAASTCTTEDTYVTGNLVTATKT